ncbi:MAG: diguanylate cyclase, partial [Pseudomonadales bacterium]|nr:diguanylate cyclase [Pseudomonadales bacterium]
MPAIIRTNNRLSIRLLRWVIITALLAGIILSLGQILLDADRAQNELDQQTLELMHVVQDAATQAVYSIDPELAQQVVEGLFEQRAIHLAIIAHPDGTPLAEKHRPLKESQSRWLTDLIFENERSFSVKLIKEIPEPVQYGILQVKIDTAYSAEIFLDRSLVVLASGVLRASILALILFMVYYYLLTKPLRQIIGSLITIDPKDPGEHNLPTPHNHEHDELGIWVKTANRLLKGISESQTKRKNAEERALKLSRYDPLTGLPNRLMFRNHLQLTLQDAAKLNKKVAVLCCGIDDFKSVNEQYSYNLGDKLLQAFAARLTRHSNLLHASARLGSDQFALVQFNIENAYKATELAEALLAAINMPFEIDGLTISVHSTIGITIFPDDGEDPDKLLQKSEQTMMLAKT